MARNPEDVATIASWDEASDRETAIDAVVEIIMGDVRRDLANVEAPALVFATWVGQGPSADAASVERGFRSQFQFMKKWQLEVSPKSRHFIMFDEPEWMLQKMDAFLAQK